MLVMRALAGRRQGRGNSKSAGEWLQNARAFRVALGQVFGAARCSASKFDDAASARGRNLMMRTAGARIMSISGGSALSGMRAFGGPRWEGLLPGARTRAQP